MGFVDKSIRRRYHITLGDLINLINNDPHSVSSIKELVDCKIRTDTNCVIIGAQGYKDDCCLLGIRSSNPDNEGNKKVLRYGKDLQNFLRDCLIGDLYYSERTPLWFRRGRKSEDTSRPIVGYSINKNGTLILRTIDINDEIHRFDNV